MSTPRSRDLRLLAGAAGISALGDFMAIFPLVLHVQQRTGSGFAVSALIFALWGPVVLASGVAGAIVDRFENRRILIVISLAQASVVAAMLVAVDSLWALLPLMMLLGFGVAVSQPAEFELVPAAAGPNTDSARATDNRAGSEADRPGCLHQSVGARGVRVRSGCRRDERELGRLTYGDAKAEQHHQRQQRPEAVDGN